MPSVACPLADALPSASAWILPQRPTTAGARKRARHKQAIRGVSACGRPDVSVRFQVGIPTANNTAGASKLARHDNAIVACPLADALTSASVPRADNPGQQTPQALASEHATTMPAWRVRLPDALTLETNNSLTKSPCPLPYNVARARKRARHATVASVACPLAGRPDVSVSSKPARAQQPQALASEHATPYVACPLADAPTSASGQAIAANNRRRSQASTPRLPSVACPLADALTSASASKPKG